MSSHGIRSAPVLHRMRRRTRTRRVESTRGSSHPHTVLAAAAAILLCAFLAWAASPAAAQDGNKIASKAPDFTVKGINGETYHLEELLKEGPVLLDFWTTWCKPCMQELPHLQRIYEKYREQGFTLLGIPSDDQRTAAKIKPTILSKKFDFPNAPDPDRRIGNAYSVRNYPTSILIAPTGEIVAVAQGYRPGDEKALEEKIVALLGPQGTEEGELPEDEHRPAPGEEGNH